MANIHETISEVAKLNPELARQLQKYVKDHSYGLVFENNLPEAVRLYKKTVCQGDVVNILPPRGQFDTEENSVPWVVKAVKDGVATIVHEDVTKDVPVEDVVVTVSYRDVIYPGLREIDRIERGNPEDPYHMVINAENYHALEALTYAYAGKVDCIYIDPPYNKPNSKDWKYNCNYVGSDDQYRHSKWLAFMERRLKLAKQLLNPDNSVLIITIDEIEYARLSLLLEQLFPTGKIQMVSSVINPAGAGRQAEFARTDEYIFFVRFGEAAILPESREVENVPVIWDTLRRSSLANARGKHGKGACGPNQFYPIYVNVSTGRIEEIGEPVFEGIDRFTAPQRDGCVAVFPVRPDGTEMNWGIKPEEAKERLKAGYLRAGKYSPKAPQQFVISYVTGGNIRDIESGVAVIDGYEADGSVRAYYPNGRDKMPTTNWNRATHDAQRYGTNVLKPIIGERFTYPKSLYAVQDCLRFCIGDKKEALVIDFFAGSGTTLHAVNLLNAEDGGHRRCICVTNNEVSDSEEKKFTEAGLRPSDNDWEKYGIANYVTWPRTKCTIEGVNVKGEPLAGNYIGSDIPMADGFKANAIFCELTYESAWPIRLDNAFAAIAPILWMQAGCRGPIIRRIGKSYLTTDYYGVLFDYNQASKFCDKVKSTPSIKTVFVVTDDQRRYSNMCRRLPGVEVHRLYETYLRTFKICGEGGLD